MTMIKINRTLEWTDVCAALLAKYARLQKFDAVKKPSSENFVEFMATYPNVALKDMVNFTEMVTKHAKLKNADVTDVTTLKEDNCLFSTQGNDAAALEIVSQYLRTLNTGGKVPAFWAFLDEDEKAIVHFVHHKGYYAELYCLDFEASSALHILDDVAMKTLIPVVFMPKFDDKMLDRIISEGNHHLHEYLPRERFDLLSKGGKRKSGYVPRSRQKQFAEQQKPGTERWRDVL